MAILYFFRLLYYDGFPATTSRSKLGFKSRKGISAGLDLYVPDGCEPQFPTISKCLDRYDFCDAIGIKERCQQLSALKRCSEIAKRLIRVDIGGANEAAQVSYSSRNLAATTLPTAFGLWCC